MVNSVENSHINKQTFSSKIKTYGRNVSSGNDAKYFKQNKDGATKFGSLN